MQISWPNNMCCSIRRSWAKCIHGTTRHIGQKQLSQSRQINTTSPGGRGQDRSMTKDNKPHVRQSAAEPFHGKKGCDQTRSGTIQTQGRSPINNRRHQLQGWANRTDGRTDKRTHGQQELGTSGEVPRQHAILWFVIAGMTTS